MNQNRSGPKMMYRELFVHSCIGVITAASVGTFTQVYELKTSIAVMQEDVARSKIDLFRLSSEMDKVKDEIKLATLDLVRLRGECLKRG